MTSEDFQINADLIARVIERVKALPEFNAENPQNAILGVLRMMEHEYRHAHEIMPTEG